MKKLALIVIVICLLIGEAVILGNYFIHRTANMLNLYSTRERELRLTLAIVYFNNHYRVWPCPSGSLNNDVISELAGFQTAHINTQHIDFWKLVGGDYSITDLDGRPFTLKIDDSTGTCSITGVLDN